MKSTAIILLTAILTFSAGALQRKSPDKIDLDQLTAETLLDASHSKDHIAFVWYIPSEYWDAVISQNREMGKREKARAGKTMKTLTVIAVVQGDVPHTGPVRYYEKIFLQDSLRFIRIDALGRKYEYIPYKTSSGEVKKLLESIVPALRSSVGPLAENLQFFVFNDQAADGSRILDPYRPGALEIELKRKDGQKLEAKLEFPLNALFVPRRCPNGKPADVTWKYCPWTGKKLPR